MKKTHTLAKGMLLFAILAAAPIVFAETTAEAGADASVTAGSETTAPRDSASGQATGKRQYQPVIIRKGIASTTKEHVKEVRGEIRDKMLDIREKASTTRAQVKEKIEDRRGEIKDKRDELKSQVKEKRMMMFKKQSERVLHRLEAALERLTNIAGRIDSRITKLGEKGVDVSKAKADMIIAKTKIEAARVKLSEAKVAILAIINDTAVTTDGSAEEAARGAKMKLIQEQAHAVQEALKEAHKALVLAVTDLKGKSEGKGVRATTTATITE